MGKENGDGYFNGPYRLRSSGCIVSGTDRNAPEKERRIDDLDPETYQQFAMVMMEYA